MPAKSKPKKSIAPCRVPSHQAALANICLTSIKLSSLFGSLGRCTPKNLASGPFLDSPDSAPTSAKPLLPWHAPPGSEGLSKSSVSSRMNYYFVPSMILLTMTFFRFLSTVSKIIFPYGRRPKYAPLFASLKERLRLASSMLRIWEEDAASPNTRFSVFSSTAYSVVNVFRSCLFI
jgi:hypothetical protein